MMLYSCPFLFHFHVYIIEKTPFEKGKTCHFFAQTSKHFLTIVHQSPSCTVKVECTCLPFRGLKQEVRHSLNLDLFLLRNSGIKTNCSYCWDVNFTGTEDLITGSIITKKAPPNSDSNIGRYQRSQVLNLIISCMIFLLYLSTGCLAHQGRKRREEDQVLHYPPNTLNSSARTNKSHLFLRTCMKNTHKKFKILPYLQFKCFRMAVSVVRNVIYNSSLLFIAKCLSFFQP